MRSLEELAPVVQGTRVLELGCAPARWLVWYAERFGALSVGLESSSMGASISRRNLVAAGVPGEIHEGDLLTADLGTFELVLSLGVIEHFTDVRAAFAQHAAFVKRGGRLVLGMPNFRGLTGFFQRWADPEQLALHNQAAMDVRLYEGLAAKHGLRMDAVRYVDGIDPDLIKVSRLSARLVLMPFRALRMLRLSDHLNAPMVSSYLVVRFARP
jgi:SAM-dependent methyltransferase